MQTDWPMTPPIFSYRRPRGPYPSHRCSVSSVCACHVGPGRVVRSPASNECDPDKYAFPQRPSQIPSCIRLKNSKKPQQENLHQSPSSRHLMNLLDRVMRECDAVVEAIALSTHHRLALHDEGAGGYTPSWRCLQSAHSACQPPDPSRPPGLSGVR